jgi:hypothetical protein
MRHGSKAESRATSISVVYTDMNPFCDLLLKPGIGKCDASVHFSTGGAMAGSTVRSSSTADVTSVNSLPIFRRLKFFIFLYSYPDVFYGCAFSSHRSLEAFNIALGHVYNRVGN